MEKNFYYKNLNNTNKIQASMNKFGLSIIENYFNVSTLSKILNDVKLKLNEVKYVNPAKNIKKAEELGDNFRQENNRIKYNLTKNQLKKGLRYYSKLTNQISIKNPLINIKDLKKIVFDENLIDFADRYLKTESKLGDVKIGCHLKNDLPENCINFFHTDAQNKFKAKDFNSKKLIKDNDILKVIIPLKGDNEYNHILKRKDYFKNVPQYFNFTEMRPEVKKYLVKPILKKGDFLIIDGTNFFHQAESPKSEIRVILYITFIKKNKMKYYDLKLLKKDYKKLSVKQRNFFSFHNQYYSSN
tara:strand:+ start:562 stop:1461 length:900 start_codon:yes stop_codon:yes gene_type:complete